MGEMGGQGDRMPVIADFGKGRQWLQILGERPCSRGGVFAKCKTNVPFSNSKNKVCGLAPATANTAAVTTKVKDSITT